MKTCPVCQAVAFDDAEICYGCLHRFSEEEALHQVNDDMAKEGVATEIIEEVESRKTILPVFSIRFAPEADGAGGMVLNCTVEMA